MDYSKLRVHQLKEELKRRGFKTPLPELKKDLIAKLKEADQMYQDGLRQPPVSELIKNGPQPQSRDPYALIHQPSFVEMRGQRRKEREERARITLWRKPLTTIQYFILELCITIVGWLHRLWINRLKVLTTLGIFILSVVICHLEGPHQKYIEFIQKKTGWCVYWIGLGILSSVGLGTGLHTFLLYLGPHIASVTLAAFECMSVDFPEPPFPDEILCPDVKGDKMSIWMVLSKVRLAACMWGAGTALGELPPYFMAKAARLSGQEPDSEDYEEFEDLLEQDSESANRSFAKRATLFMKQLVEKAGFLGIMACASIPNPLFDLAGITCGHFLVPFWTFFGATLIGKAIIKTHIQQVFVIVAFSEHHVDMVVDLIGNIPYIGPPMQAPFREYLQKQKEKLHKGRTSTTKEPSWLSWLFEKLILAMVIYFVLSIVNSMAQRYAKRLQEKSSKSKSH